MPTNSVLTSIHHFSVSLAHRYFDDSLSRQENQELFGRMTSPLGLGSNLDFDVETVFSEEKPACIGEIKKSFDHRSFLVGTQDFEVSSLESFCRWAVDRHKANLLSLNIHECERLSVRWERAFGDDLMLRWKRPISVIWKRPKEEDQLERVNGARLNCEFWFKGPYTPNRKVLIPRSFLEEKLEHKLSKLERDGWQIPDPVNRTEQFSEEFLGALLNDCGEISNLLHAIRVEIADGQNSIKKWLIRYRVQSR